MMEISDLRTFEAVARLGGMGKAGVELNTVQSNITARIRLLERELRVSLFHRTSRGVALTEAGERLLPYALRLRQLLNEARHSLHDAEPSGALQIGSIEANAACRLVPIIVRFSNSYPAVRFSLRSGTDAALMDQVLDYRLDGAFVCGPVFHPDLDELPAFDEELAVIAPPWFQSLGQVFASNEMKIVVLPQGCSYRIRLEKFMSVNFHQELLTFEVGTLAAITECVAAGIGISLLPFSAVEGEVTERRVTAIRMKSQFRGTIAKTVFVRRRNATASAAMRLFIETATHPGTIAAE